MVRRDLDVIGQSGDFGEGKDRILPPNRQKSEGLFVQGLRVTHLAEGVLVTSPASCWYAPMAGATRRTTSAS
jgi:hypothetical protein